MDFLNNSVQLLQLSFEFGGTCFASYRLNWFQCLKQTNLFNKKGSLSRSIMVVALRKIGS